MSKTDLVGLLDDVEANGGNVPAELRQAAALPAVIAKQAARLRGQAQPSPAELLDLLTGDDPDAVVDGLVADAAAAHAREAIASKLGSATVAAEARSRARIRAAADNMIVSMRPAFERAVESGDRRAQRTIEHIADQLRRWSPQDKDLCDRWLELASWSSLPDEWVVKIRRTGARTGLQHVASPAPTEAELLGAGGVPLLPSMSDVKAFAVAYAKSAKRHDPAARLAGEVDQIAVEGLRRLAHPTPRENVNVRIRTPAKAA